MSNSVELLEARQTWAPPVSTPLDEAAWQAWVAKNRAQEERDTAARVKALKWVSIVAVIAAAIWLHPTSHGVLAGFLEDAAR